MTRLPNASAIPPTAIHSPPQARRPSLVVNSVSFLVAGDANRRHPPLNPNAILLATQTGQVLLHTPSAVPVLREARFTPAVSAELAAPVGFGERGLVAAFADGGFLR